MTNNKKTSNHYASPACLAYEIDPTYFDPLAVDPQQAQDVARWRKSERTRLLAERAAVSVDGRQSAALAIASHLDQLLADRFETLSGLTISAWWPIKAELDLRFWLAGLEQRGARAAFGMPILSARAKASFLNSGECCLRNLFFFPDCLIMIRLCRVVYSLNRVSIIGGQDHPFIM